MLPKVDWSPRSVRTVLLVCAFALSLACGRGSKAPSTTASPVVLDGALANKLVKAGASQQLQARILVSAERKTSTARPAVNMALLVDTSGSMEGRAIEDARAAAIALLDTLAPEDKLSVVAFDSKAEVLLPSTKIADADIKELRTKIGAMRARGTTDMESGLKVALSVVEANLVANGVNRIVMLGDGVPNDSRQIDQLVARAASRGISITTLGLGNDYDEVLMGRIAQGTGGKFNYVEDSQRVASFFKEEVVRLHRVAAKMATLELHPGPGVVVRNVVGRPMQPSEHGVSVLLGDLTLGEEQDVVVELAVNEQKDGANVEALDAVLRYQDGETGEPREDRVFLGAKATADAARIEAAKDVKVAEAITRAQSAAATLEQIENLRKTDAPAPNAAPPSMAAKRPAPADVRRIHNEAIQNFQARH